MARVDQATHRAVWTLRADDLTLTVGSGLQAAANLKQAPARNRLHAGNMLHAPILTYSLPTRAGSAIQPYSPSLDVGDLLTHAIQLVFHFNDLSSNRQVICFAANRVHLATDFLQ